MSSGATTLPHQATPRRRWRVRAAATFLAIAAFMFAGFWFYSDYAAQKAWDDAEAEADRLDPRWRLADIEADREVIPDEQNAALLLAAIVREAGKKAVPPAASYFRYFDKHPPTARMNNSQLKQLRLLLSAVPKPLLEQTHQLHHLQKGRHKPQFADDYYTTPTVEMFYANRALWLLDEAFLCIEEDNLPDAVKACHTLLNVGQAIGSEPFAMSLWMRVELQSEALCTLERILAQGEISSEALEGMQIRIEKDIAESSWLTAVRGERAGVHHFFSNVRKGKVLAAELPPRMRMGRILTRKSFSEWITSLVSATPAKHYPESLRFLNAVVEVAKLPIHERRAKMNECEAKREDLAAGCLAFPWPALHRSETISQGRLRSAQAAQACERYRLNHDDWPATLDVLVQAKLITTVPTDPIDNQPLRYCKTKDGIVIYSIGPDEKDDGGNIDHKSPATPGVDVGFRLWNPTSRRQPPIESPEGK